MTAIRRTLSVAAGLALAAALAGCGGGGNPVQPPTPSPPPTPTARTIILSGSLSLPSRTIDVEPFGVPSPGTVDITVDWTFAASPIGVYVIRGACDLDRFNARTCDFVTRSEGGQKPRVITLPGVAAGSYSLLVANFSSGDESLSLQIGHTSGGTASTARADSAGADGADVHRRAVQVFTGKMGAAR